MNQPLLLLWTLGSTVALNATPLATAQLPNIILVMADDQGWGDTSYNGHEVIKTPALDQMAAEGIQFNRFYASSPVCSPTRASVLTGRHPSRMGILGANHGHLPQAEYTLGEMCKQAGYVTGHFGKWHLGTLTKTVQDSNRGGRTKHEEHYSPPWLHGFDRCFSTEAKVPTWNPMVNPENGKPYGTRYWNENGEIVTENLEGDDCRIILDRALPFMSEAAANEQPFLAIVWLHAPHRPIVASTEITELYSNDLKPNQRDYYGIITAVDQSMARLRSHLSSLGIADNTMLWFTSDNGPEGTAKSGEGSTAGLRGRKRSLYEGGVRVPGLLVWPSRIPFQRQLSAPVSTMDYLPTIAEVLGRDLPTTRRLDGVSLIPLLTRNAQDDRPGSRGISFQSGKASAFHMGSLKAIRPKAGAVWELYDLAQDPGETKNLADTKEQVLSHLVAEFEKWETEVQTERDS